MPVPDVGVFRSSNDGTTWTASNSGMTDTSVYTLAASGSNIFAGIYHGYLFLSTNNGSNWTAVMTGKRISCFAVDGMNIFTGTDAGVFHSSNNGVNWTVANTGLTDTTIGSLAITNSFLFAGTNGNGVWRRPLSELITGIENNSNQMPLRFSLDQNFPNPFNPSTVITYQLPIHSFVILKIYDVLGREVRTLVNESQHSGNHSVNFSDKNLSSGVYFYRLEAGIFTETKKLVLLR